MLATVFFNIFVFMNICQSDLNFNSEFFSEKFLTVYTSGSQLGCRELVP